MMAPVQTYHDHLKSIDGLPNVTDETNNSLSWVEISDKYYCSFELRVPP
jgi:hypothetical protein